MNELPAGQVTIADLYRELVGMRTEIGKALTRLEVIDSRNQDADRLHSDHESRIRALEAFRWKMMGVYIILSLLSGYVGYLLGHVH